MTFFHHAIKTIKICFKDKNRKLHIIKALLGVCILPQHLPVTGTLLETLYIHTIKPGYAAIYPLGINQSLPIWRLNK